MDVQNTISAGDNPDRVIAVASTFTADPIEESLTYWIERLEMDATVRFAPYSQVFQELLDPSSLFSRNEAGINIALIRIEDWIRDDRDADDDERVYWKAKIERNTGDLIDAFGDAAERLSVPYIVCLCPASPDSLAERWKAAIFQEAEERLNRELESLSDVYVVTSREIAATYEVEDYYDKYGDRQSHIPYKPEFYVALGTMIARRIHSITTEPYKVIALDCDQTLWTGVCGEVGAAGIEITEPRKVLQRFMLKQVEAGMLLCICSKNNPADLDEVFDTRDDMLLKREHIVACRANWKPKSENLRSLSEELNVGLDKFILLDDSPVECAEVDANCPEVLTLELPSEEAVIERFLRHTWVMDHFRKTTEGRNRTVYYQQNREREQVRRQTQTLDDFIDGLDIKVKISSMSPRHINRVSELTWRTNQLNCTTIRRRESEIEQLIQRGSRCEIVEVEDRFGDYGVVGVMIYDETEHGIAVDTFLLSCRALGRRVEHRMMARLGEIAEDRGLDLIDILYCETDKNRPAFEFLEAIGDRFKHQREKDWLYRIPADFAVALSSMRSAAGA